MEHEEYIENERMFCEEAGYLKNSHNQFIYKSSDGKDVTNLIYMLHDYKMWLIENKIVKLII